MIKKQKLYVTTAIPYVNGPPHIGHAMDYLIADIWARYERARGNEVRFSAGLDEHGTKVEQKARENHVSPQEFVDDLAPRFLDMLDKLDVTNTDFVRTSDPDHMRRVQEIWRRLDAAGVIYRGKYEGWYCAGCEAYVSDTEAKSLNFSCPDHQKPFEKLEEENYYLRVSQFTDQIREFVKSHVVPEFRGREILEMIKDGAKDVSISRPREKLSWGVSVPGDETQVMYVWIDALSNYITALGFPDDDDYKQWWSAKVQVIGKDILRFHAIIWPAMLLALGLELPKNLLAHGFVNVDSAKMSKSVGNVVDPFAIIDDYGVDAFRYFFSRHIPTFEDGDFTWEKFEEAYNGELANDLGNLVSRVANMAKRYMDGVVEIDAEFTHPAIEKYHELMEQFRFSEAIGTAWEIVSHLNKFIEEKQPWRLAKTDIDETRKVLNYLASGLQKTSELLYPFMPSAAEKIGAALGEDNLDEIGILFPKIYKHSNDPRAKGGTK